MIKISIIVPIYKVEQYVCKCIDSIIDQENCGADLECILIDDCSPDNSMAIVHSIVEKYNGNITFTFLKHEINKGLSAARNTGIDAAHGDYILFVDSDDWLPSDSISRFVKVLQEHPNIDMISGNSYRVAEKCGLPYNISEATLLNNYQLRKSLVNYDNITCSAWNKLVKADLVVKNKFYEGIIFEDKHWSYILCKDIKQAVIIPDITYIYENDHPLSIANTANTKQNASAYAKSLSIIGHTILDAPYKDLYSESLIYLLNHLIVALHLQCDNEDRQLIKGLRKRVVFQSFKNKRWLITLYLFILTYSPTSHLFDIKWVRRHYYHIEQIGKKIAEVSDRIHKTH